MVVVPSRTNASLQQDLWNRSARTAASSPTAHSIALIAPTRHSRSVQQASCALACQYLHYCASQASNLRTWRCARIVAASSAHAPLLPASSDSSERQRCPHSSCVRTCTVVPVKQVNWGGGGIPVLPPRARTHYPAAPMPIAPVIRLMPASICTFVLVKQVT